MLNRETEQLGVETQSREVGLLPSVFLLRKGIRKRFEGPIPILPHRSPPRRSRAQIEIPSRTDILCRRLLYSGCARSRLTIDRGTYPDSFFGVINSVGESYSV